MSRSDWVDGEYFRALLAALTPQNRAALIVSQETGLRIGDVLQIKTEQARRGRWTVTEQKTGKRRRVRISTATQKELLSIAGAVYVFEGRCDWKKTRTRQAVNKDLARAAAAFRIPAGLTVSPHSARKIYAVDQLRRTNNPARVRELLQHSDEALTMLYAMSDHLTAQKVARLSDQQRRQIGVSTNGV